MPLTVVVQDRESITDETSCMRVLHVVSKNLPKKTPMSFTLKQYYFVSTFFVFLVTRGGHLKPNQKGHTNTHTLKNVRLQEIEPPR